MSLGLKDLDITERIFELEYSSGESIILLRQSDILYSKIGKLHNSRVGHFGVERILKRFQAQNTLGNTKNSTSNGSLITVPVAKK